MKGCLKVLLIAGALAAQVEAASAQNAAARIYGRKSTEDSNPASPSCITKYSDFTGTKDECVYPDYNNGTPFYGNSCDGDKLVEKVVTGCTNGCCTGTKDLPPLDCKKYCEDTHKGALTGTCKTAIGACQKYRPADHMGRELQQVDSASCLCGTPAEIKKAAWDEFIYQILLEHIDVLTSPPASSPKPAGTTMSIE